MTAEEHLKQITGDVVAHLIVQLAMVLAQRDAVQERLTAVHAQPPDQSIPSDGTNHE
jgi:hypothetical protein